MIEYPVIIKSIINIDYYANECIHRYVLTIELVLLTNEWIL